MFGDKLAHGIQSFLSHREQVVVLNGVHPDIAKVLSGVPQGTVLGPLLFILIKFICKLEQQRDFIPVSFFADESVMRTVCCIKTISTKFSTGHGATT